MFGYHVNFCDYFMMKFQKREIQAYVMQQTQVYEDVLFFRDFMGSEDTRAKNLPIHATWSQA